MSQYYLSHLKELESEAIFVIREVLALKRLGFRIDVASINSCDRAPQGLTADERAEAEDTYYVKAHGMAGALVAHLHTGMTRPFDYLRGWALVARLGGTDVDISVMVAV